MLFTLLVGAVAVQRLAELGLSARHVRLARARGGVEVGAGHYPWMVLLHSVFLASCLLEVWLLGRPPLPVLAGAALLVMLVATILRYWAITTLGERWTTRVICFPSLPRVTSGPYRWLRHPNYLAVGLEVIALPLVHSAWITAVVFSLANAALLRIRIRVEEAALASYCGGATTAGEP